MRLAAGCLTNGLSEFRIRESFASSNDGAGLVASGLPMAIDVPSIPNLAAIFTKVPRSWIPGSEKPDRHVWDAGVSLLQLWVVTGLDQGSQS